MPIGKNSSATHITRTAVPHAGRLVILTAERVMQIKGPTLKSVQLLTTLNPD
jgi:hypothetical protein